MAHTEIAEHNRDCLLSRMCATHPRYLIYVTSYRLAVLPHPPVANAWLAHLYRPAEENLMPPGMRIREAWRKLSHVSNKPASNIVKLPTCNYSISLRVSSL